MTQERLRELLRERVAEETMPDHSARAWQRASVVRRRHRLGVVAGVVVATVGVSAGIAALDSAPPEPPPADSRPDAASDLPDATYQGTPVWWSPDQLEEQELEPVRSPFPAEIDLDTSSPFVPGELDHALAAFARGREVVLLGPDGELRTVDVSRLAKVTKPNGYSYFPTTPWMLPPDGTRLVFPQQDHDAVFSIRTGEWSTAPEGTAVEEQEPPTPPFDALTAQQHGAAHQGAASWGMGVPLPAPPGTVDDPGPEFLVADPAGTPFVLVFDWPIGDGQDGRYKNCCPVAGWLDQDWVVYESRQGQPLLVAWHVGTHEFRLVSRIRGAYDVAGFV